MIKKKVAVFDLDGTIFRSSLLIEMVEMLVREKIFPEKARKQYLPAQKIWLDRKGDYDGYIISVVKTFEENIKGVKEKDLLRAVDKVILEHKDRVYRFTRDLVSDLKERGYFLLAISHSPKYIADRFAKKFGFDKVYGRLLLLDRKKKLTGEGLLTELIADKAKIFRRAIEKENLALKNSIGVGDTESDIEFLKLVENPVCFNPNLILFKEARKRGWRVVVERKNVIYEINPGKVKSISYE